MIFFILNDVLIAVKCQRLLLSFNATVFLRNSNDIFCKSDRKLEIMSLCACVYVSMSECFAIKIC
jgi:hypothetical protein